MGQFYISFCSSCVKMYTFPFVGETKSWWPAVYSLDSWGRYPPWRRGREEREREAEGWRRIKNGASSLAGRKRNYISRTEMFRSRGCGKQWKIDFKLKSIVNVCIIHQDFRGKNTKLWRDVRICLQFISHIIIFIN